MRPDYSYSYKAWSEAFAIFAKYGKDDEYGEVSCEHDIIYVGNPDVVSDEDKARLEYLGWSINEHYGCFYHHT